MKSKLKSIKIKLVLVFLTLVFFVMVVSGIFLRISIENHEENRILDNLRQFAMIINAEIIQEYIEPALVREALYSPAHRLGAMPNLQITVLFEGVPLVSTSIRDNNSRVVIAAKVGEESFNPWERTVDPYTDMVNESSSYAIPVTALDYTYIIYLRQSVDNIRDSLDSTTNAIAISVVIALVLAIVLGVWFANTLTGPIFTLAKMANEIAAGNLRQQIPKYSDDEVGQLTENFNKMSNNLYQMMENMSSDKNRMEIIIQNMTDGLIAFSTSGKLIHANLAALELLSLSSIDDIDYKILMDMISEKGIEGTGVKQTIIEANQKFIDVSFATHENNKKEIDGIVLVLRDVTRHTKLDNLRREFVANVSHEIRTPLTVIKTHAETLLDMDQLDFDMAKSFLTTIDLEVDRMTLLATDLLELSHFDNKQFSFNMESTDLFQILENSVKQTKVLAQKKSQSIVLSPAEKMLYTCDQARINQVFVNIISNAIKYSGENSTIEVSTKATDKYIDVIIKDNGIGIPKEDINRIFERFYRVDKGRSRAMGGTGLGLAIVKEILEVHGATINLESKYQKGTTVNIRFFKM